MGKREEENRRRVEEEKKAQQEVQQSKEQKSKAKGKAKASASTSKRPEIPYQFEIMLDKTKGGSLGINVATLSDGSLKIEHVGEEITSLMGAWNAENPGSKVLP